MPTPRSEQKQKTRRALLDAALRNLGPDRGFASLSLREVAREAGIAPTSFYRHFHDLEQLGLALVDEAGMALRESLKAARARAKAGGDVVRASVETFMEFLGTHQELFRLLLRERAGGSEAFRGALRAQFEHFAAEIAADLQRDDELTALDAEGAQLLAEAMVTIVFNSGAEALEMDDNARSTAAERIIRQLRMLRAGAQRLAEMK